VLKWFLIALSGRPGMSLDISAHFEPSWAKSLKMSSSSLGVKGDLSTTVQDKGRKTMDEVTRTERWQQGKRRKKIKRAQRARGEKETHSLDPDGCAIARGTAFLCAIPSDWQ